MKKIFSVFLLLLLAANLSIVQGQRRFNKYIRRPEPNFGYGIKAGINLASQRSPGNEANVVVKNILGINAGGYCNYFFNRKAAFQSELLVSVKGSNWKDYYSNMKDIVTYLDLPLLVRFQPIRYLSLVAGPEASYRINATQKDINAGVKSDIKDYYKPFDFGLIAGAEANLKNKINITVRYVYGIVPATTNVEYVDPWYNNYFQISVGYRLAGK